jgi:hypothetical protein
MNRAPFLAAALLGFAARGAAGCGNTVTAATTSGTAVTTGAATTTGSGVPIDVCDEAASKAGACLGTSSTTGGAGSGVSCIGQIECEAECINAASCADITAPEPGSSYETCLMACTGQTGGTSSTSTTTGGGK